MVQRVVVDSNMLQTWTLRAYLLEAQDRVVVLPDFVWIEMYKQQSVAGLIAAFSVIRDFPDRVVVLKSGKELADIDPRCPDLIEQMLRDDAAGSIRMMAEALSQAESGEPLVMAQLIDQWSGATADMDGMLEGAADIIQSLPEIAEAFSTDELRRCRTNGRYASAMLEDIFGAADQIYETLLEAHDATPGHLSHRYDAYLYRYALAILVYALWWIRNGSQAPKRLDRARNDFVDLGFAVCGSYFDGLMTDDAEARWMHDNLSAALSATR
jgi:hypothetical protein